MTNPTNPYQTAVEHVAGIIADNLLLSMAAHEAVTFETVETLNKQGWTYETTIPRSRAIVRHEDVVLSRARLRQAWSLAHAMTNIPPSRQSSETAPKPEGG